MDREKQAKIDAVVEDIDRITARTANELLKQAVPDSIKVRATKYKVTAFRRKVRWLVKVKRGPGKGRIRKSWLRAYPVKFTFLEDNGSPIREFFNAWAADLYKEKENAE